MGRKIGDFRGPLRAFSGSIANISQFRSLQGPSRSTTPFSGPQGFARSGRHPGAMIPIRTIIQHLPSLQQHQQHVLLLQHPRNPRDGNLCRFTRTWTTSFSWATTQTGIQMFLHYQRAVGGVQCYRMFQRKRMELTTGIQPVGVPFRVALLTRQHHNYNYRVFLERPMMGSNITSTTRKSSWTVWIVLAFTVTFLLRLSCRPHLPYVL